MNPVHEIQAQIEAACQLRQQGLFRGALDRLAIARQMIDDANISAPSRTQLLDQVIDATGGPNQPKAA